MLNSTRLHKGVIPIHKEVIPKSRVFTSGSRACLSGIKGDLAYIATAAPLPNLGPFFPAHRRC